MVVIGIVLLYFGISLSVHFSKGCAIYKCVYVVARSENAWVRLYGAGLSIRI